MRGIENFNLKNQAVILRKKGFSYLMIKKRLGVPKATLNGWFKGLVLGKKACERILTRKRNSLKVSRQKALMILKRNRQDEIKNIKTKAEEEFCNFNFRKQDKELLLSMLYLGEGFKNRSSLGLGNSDPEIVQMFVKLLKDVYGVESSSLVGFLHLRMDQDFQKEKKYWSKKLHVPISNFRKPQFDKRTSGQKTWTNYHGVCIICCYKAVLDKRLEFVQKILKRKILGG